MDRLLVWLLGFLGEFLLIFIRNLRAARGDNQTLLEGASQIVKDIDTDHPEWENDKKRIYARDALMVYARSLGSDLRTSLANALVELAVQRLKSFETR